MIKQIEKTLSEMKAPRLVKIVLAALDEMNEANKISFIAKHIDAKTALSGLKADDPGAFLDEVEMFCQNCLNGDYYSDEDDVQAFFTDREIGYAYYDYDWDYDEYYRNTEWAENFSRLFGLSMMYIRSGDISTGYEANARLLACLHELSRNDSFLGTSEPKEYITADWDELFTLHYTALFQYHTNSKNAIEKAFQCWMNFGNPCVEGFLANVQDISLAEPYILGELKNAQTWLLQSRCFTLLEQLYTSLDLSFDKVSQAQALIGCNVYFYLFVLEGLSEQANWPAVIETAQLALPQIPFVESEAASTYKKSISQTIRADIQAKLVNAYENLGDFARAFESAKSMFQEAPGFELYKRARHLAKKDSDVSLFLAQIENSEKTSVSEYRRKELLYYIYSYEGKTEKILDLALSQNINQNYYHRKYTALSLIYRAVKGKGDVGQSLSEYLDSAAGQNGIHDMTGLEENADAKRQMELSLSGADLLKEMVAFHIAGATRNRYAKAAYYMCVLRDVFVYLKQENDFRSYFKEIISQNSRRPALRDEMSIVYGKEAVDMKNMRHF